MRLRVLGLICLSLNRLLLSLIAFLCSFLKTETYYEKYCQREFIFELLIFFLRTMLAWCIIGLYTGVGLYEFQLNNKG